ncbi:pyridoxamine 5'-phosphate oxidase [uncultured Microscilla sp.]|uniref:pyridoxamine 5'-phosphate oxidase n=1 Tax=uncultured Microscilla sp. TaxID=432653 RepID=UPI002612D4E9|nr:pyridoxamine 5'-phosphate oxidase [uncultured Microscilla sp.]
MDNSAKISQIRTDYTLHSLHKKDVAAHPITQFNQWLEEAIKAEVNEPTAMHLATATKAGKPSGRVVLLKDTNPAGFTFYTNYTSRKGTELEENPQACLTFFWPELQRQVRVYGEVKKVSDQTSADYFSTRPRGSQISALASPQSYEVANREVLESKVAETTAEYEGKTVERPLHWGGYVLVPHEVEFWQGRASRLHDRLLYEGGGNEWIIKRLAP